MSFSEADHLVSINMCFLNESGYGLSEVLTFLIIVFMMTQVHKRTVRGNYYLCFFPIDFCAMDRAIATTHSGER